MNKYLIFAVYHYEGQRALGVIYAPSHEIAFEIGRACKPINNYGTRTWWYGLADEIEVYDVDAAHNTVENGWSGVGGAKSFDYTIRWDFDEETE